MAPPPSSEGSLYLCVADVLVTDRGNAEQPRTFTMRSVAHVLQKTLKIGKPLQSCRTSSSPA